MIVRRARGAVAFERRLTASRARGAWRGRRATAATARGAWRGRSSMLQMRQARQASVNMRAGCCASQEYLSQDVW